MPLASDQPTSSSSLKGKGGKIINHSRHPSTGRPVDGDSSQPKFPRIEDCAHFHYEAVDYGRIKVSFIEESADGLRLNGALSLEGFNPAFNVRITCKDNTWVVRRNLPHFGTLDEWLHECVFDRKFSHLPVLNIEDLRTQTLDDIQNKLRNYLSKLSAITDLENGEAQIFCAPVLHWLEIDNHGRNLAPHAFGDVADINIPAIAAARVVRRYQARDDDELNLDVGDMVSIIEMGVSGWWRGKQGMRVGSFPSQCVRRINSATDVVGTHDRTFSSSSYTPQSQEKPIVRKHGKFMEFLRSFLDTRPSKASLKEKGILRERVFGCDLGELLHRTDEDIPAVVADCTRFVEKHGVVDGIYRVSGGSTHIRHLKYEFDSDRRPDLESHHINAPNVADVPGMTKENNLRCDAHSVAGLCKLYFRELPNPLLTYQLYNRFASAVTEYEAEDRLLKVHDVVQQLPPPHYRTLKHLITHLRFMSLQEDRTSMHSRNLAIVWAPNLLRSREIEAGLAAFTEARVQSVVTEFLIVNGDLLFSEKLQTIQYDAEHKPPRPRSLMIVPTPKLISLEEAQARSKSGVVTPVSQTNSPLDAPISGVRLRNAPDKSSANEKRKRGKKTASACTSNSPFPTRSSKKGHRHATSEPFNHSPRQQDSPVTPSRQSGGFGWKVKLGSFLRKSAVPPANLVFKQGSLRRTQSCDSLRLAHETIPKLSDDTSEFSNLGGTLSRAKSCEDTGCSDRSHPEPQVPHSTHLTLPPLRANASSIEPLKPPADDTTESKVRVRCSSPFCALENDLPSVMDENGLDFDPLSFRLANLQSPIQKGAESQVLFRNNGGEVDDYSEDSITELNSVPKSFHKVDPAPANPPDIPKPLKPEPNPGAERRPITTPKTIALSQKLQSVSPDRVDYLTSQFPNSCLRPIPGPISENISHAPLEANISCNNNTAGQKFNDCPLDDLTAESFSPSPAPLKKPARSSAAERLGLKRVKSGLPSGIFKKPPAADENDKKWKIQQRVEVPTPIAENSSGRATHQSNHCDRKISVQVYNLPGKKHLKKDNHYGSFIALVGSAVETDYSKNLSSVPTTTLSQSAPGTSQVMSSKSPKLDESSYRGASINADFASRSPISKPFWYEPKVVNARLCNSKLETFSPAGKCRQNYPDVGVNSSGFSGAENPQFPSQVPLKSRNTSFESRHQNYSGNDLNLSVPGVHYQRHGRSYSMSDGRGPDAGQTYCVRPSRHPQTPQYSGMMYENRTYEDFYHFRGKSRKAQLEALPRSSTTNSSFPQGGSYCGQNYYHPQAPHGLETPLMATQPGSVPVSGPFYRRNSAGTAFSNPSYELRPAMQYKSRGRYDFPQNRRPPTLFASVQENSSTLSWV